MKKLVFMMLALSFIFLRVMGVPGEPGEGVETGPSVTVDPSSGGLPPDGVPMAVEAGDIGPQGRGGTPPPDLIGSGPIVDPDGQPVVSPGSVEVDPNTGLSVSPDGAPQPELGPDSRAPKRKRGPELDPNGRPVVDGDQPPAKRPRTGDGPVEGGPTVVDPGSVTGAPTVVPDAGTVVKPGPVDGSPTPTVVDGPVTVPDGPVTGPASETLEAPTMPDTFSRLGEGDGWTVPDGYSEEGGKMVADVPGKPSVEIPEGYHYDAGSKSIIKNEVTAAAAVDPGSADATVEFASAEALKEKLNVALPEGISVDPTTGKITLEAGKAKPEGWDGLVDKSLSFEYRVFDGKLQRTSQTVEERAGFAQFLEVPTGSKPTEYFEALATAHRGVVDGRGDQAVPQDVSQASMAYDRAIEAYQRVAADASASPTDRTSAEAKAADLTAARNKMESDFVESLRAREGRYPDSPMDYITTSGGTSRKSGVDFMRTAKELELLARAKGKDGNLDVEYEKASATLAERVLNAQIEALRSRYADRSAKKGESDGDILNTLESLQAERVALVERLAKVGVKESPEQARATFDERLENASRTSDPRARALNLEFVAREYMSRSRSSGNPPEAFAMAMDAQSSSVDALEKTIQSLMDEKGSYSRLTSSGRAKRAKINESISYLRTRSDSVIKEADGTVTAFREIYKKNPTAENFNLYVAAHTSLAKSYEMRLETEKKGSFLTRIASRLGMASIQQTVASLSKDLSAEFTALTSTAKDSGSLTRSLIDAAGASSRDISGAAVEGMKGSAEYLVKLRADLVTQKAPQGTIDAIDKAYTELMRVRNRYVDKINPVRETAGKEPFKPTVAVDITHSSVALRQMAASSPELSSSVGPTSGPGQSVGPTTGPGGFGTSAATLLAGPSGSGGGGGLLSLFGIGR